MSYNNNKVNLYSAISQSCGLTLGISQKKDTNRHGHMQQNCNNTVLKPLSHIKAGRNK